MRIARALIFAWLGATAASAQDLAPETAPESQPDPGSTLPDEPAKGLVLVQCNICHGLEWIERSGANLDGWTSRIHRMIRAGAQIPPEQIPLLAEYLAKALPERPRPPTPPRYDIPPHNPR
jgi:mono/diheme cytochrome c family protein